MGSSAETANGGNDWYGQEMRGGQTMRVLLCCCGEDGATATAGGVLDDDGVDLCG